MTFEGQYLTYAEYQTLGGSAIGETPFNLLEFEARRLIDVKTFNRLKGGTDIPQEVKLCENALINSIIDYNKTYEEVGNKASESTDGYSVSYITTDRIKEIISSQKEQYNDIIDKYLMFVVYNKEHLLYIGL